MKNLVSMRFTCNSEAVDWINRHKIPREGVVNIQSKFMGCVMRVYLDDELLKKARKHNRIMEKEDAKMQIFSFVIVGVLVIIIIWLWGVL